MGGRLIGDLCIHGEYTSTPKVVEAEPLAAHAKERGCAYPHPPVRDADRARGVQAASWPDAGGVHGGAPAFSNSPTTAAALRLAGERGFRDTVRLEEAQCFGRLLSGKQSQAGVRLREHPRTVLGEVASVSRSARSAQPLTTSSEYSGGYLPVRRGLQGFLSRFYAADACAGAAHRNARRCALAGTRRTAASWRLDIRLTCASRSIPIRRQFVRPMTDAACNVKFYAAQGADVRLTMVDGEVSVLRW